MLRGRVEEEVARRRKRRQETNNKADLKRCAWVGHSSVMFPNANHARDSAICSITGMVTCIYDITSGVAYGRQNCARSYGSQLGPKLVGPWLIRGSALAATGATPPPPPCSPVSVPLRATLSGIEQPIRPETSAHQVQDACATEQVRPPYECSFSTTLPPRLPKAATHEIAPAPSPCGRLSIRDGHDSKSGPKWYRASCILSPLLLPFRLFFRPFFHRLSTLSLSLHSQTISPKASRFPVCHFAVPSCHPPHAQRPLPTLQHLVLASAGPSPCSAHDLPNTGETAFLPRGQSFVAMILRNHHI